jgi:replication-associated recombination protein RarA
MYQMHTERGYELSAVVSTMQKAIRRGEAEVAGYFALEMVASGFDAYCWRRLLTISAEDCYGIVTQEIQALQEAYQQITKGRKKERKHMTGWVFVAKAVLLLAECRKSRDADHLVCLVYDQQQVEAQKLATAYEEGAADPAPIPDYAYDCHTARGKRAGKTKAMFFHEEFAALTPRQPGRFDHLIPTSTTHD